MNPYTKAALFLIRLIAFGLVLFGLLQLGEYLFYFLGHKKPTGGAPAILFKTVPVVMGLVLLWKSHKIAKKLTEDFDE